MEYYYELCGSRICVETDGDAYSQHGVLAPFLTTPGDVDHRFVFVLSQTLPPPQGQCLYRDTGMQIYRQGEQILRYVGAADEQHSATHMIIARRGAESRVQCRHSAYPCGITPKTVLNALEAEHLIIRNGGIILHASFICWKDQAILFTAPSGTGKSTQAELWCRLQGAELINGDRAAIRMEKGRAYAWGIPFAGSSGVGKSGKYPLRAVVYLSQAPNNDVVNLSGLEAFRKVWEGCSVNVWDKEDVALGSQIVIDVLKSVPVYHLACTPDQKAVETLLAMLEKEGDWDGKSN